MLRTFRQFLQLPRRALWPQRRCKGDVENRLYTSTVVTFKMQVYPKWGPIARRWINERLTCNKIRLLPVCLQFFLPLNLDPRRKQTKDLKTKSSKQLNVFLLCRRSGMKELGDKTSEICCLYTNSLINLKSCKPNTRIFVAMSNVDAPLLLSLKVLPVREQ